MFSRFCLIYSLLLCIGRYCLHGILCDDMGLGKTLQSICVLSADHYERATKYAETGNIDNQHLPSLVVCPTILTSHWYSETLRFAENLRPLIYAGFAATRRKQLPKIREYDLVIMSYDVLRNDIDQLRTIAFNYCILDEGHIIRNSKSKKSQAIKQIQSNHRLILSGTPIQNNALELWSLFDFLMPGFLGTERQFKSRFSKPILAARDTKASKADQEQGALAMESLHRQILPFLLRRVKEDVLDDLPPKIIQDYLCNLSDIQSRLYETFGCSSLGETAKSLVTADSAKTVSKGGGRHIFQALNFLKLVCSHPLLVDFDKVDPFVRDYVHKHKIDLHDIRHSTKLEALHQLLIDSSIGVSADAAARCSHRALIFATNKNFLSIVEKDLFKKRMPHLSYLRLDGDTPAQKRAGIVSEFNDDPTVDVLLLITSVGGLGLNLTGADTVIFLEHSWNPMVDLQAMDRAHRIGQRRTVNVYRLITKNTLEQKIMSAQRFKINMANTIVSQENSSISSMNTDQILELFTLSNSAIDRESSSKPDDEQHSSSLRSILEEAEKLTETDYSEYNVDAFRANMV